MNYKERQETEQSIANARDTFPRLWWSLYVGSIAAGFNPKQAFSLVQTWIIANNVNSVRPNDQDGQKPEEEDDDAG